MYKCTWVPSTLFNWFRASASADTEEEKGRSFLSLTKSSSPSVTLARMEKRAVHLSTAELVGKVVSPSTVLQSERKEREVIFEVSPRAEMAGLELQKPLTTALKESRR